MGVGKEFFAKRVTMYIHLQKESKMKTATISARIDPKLKKKADEIFKQLGLTSSQAITLFYKQVELQEGLPFSIRIPNALTEAALEDAQERKNLESFDTVEDLFDDLDI